MHVSDTAYHVPNRGHRDRCLQAASADVADGYDDSPVRQPQRVVPVPADDGLAWTRPIACVQRKSRHHRQALRKRGFLELHRYPFRTLVGVQQRPITRLRVRELYVRTLDAQLELFRESLLLGASLSKPYEFRDVLYAMDDICKAAGAVKYRRVVRAPETLLKLPALIRRAADIVLLQRHRVAAAELTDPLERCAQV